MSSEDQLRLTAQIVDQFSGPLREMTKSVHNFQDFMRGGTKQTIKDNREHAKLQKDLNEQFVNTGRTVTGILTPAMGALGLSVGGAGASIAELITKLKTAGGEFYKIQGAMKRTGLSSSELDAQSRMLTKITGQSIEASRAQLSGLGDVAAQLSRNYSPTLQALESTFNNLHGLITKMSGDTAAQAIDDFMEYYESHPASPDQQRKLLAAVGINPNLADASGEQIRKTLQETRAWVAANPDLTSEARQKLLKGFSELDDAADGFGRAMERNFGGPVIALVDGLAAAFRGVTKDITDFDDWWNNKAKPGNNWTTGTDKSGKEVPAGLDPKIKEFFAPRPGVFPGGSYKPPSFITGGGGSDAGNGFQDRWEGLYHPSAFKSGGGYALLQGGDADSETIWGELGRKIGPAFANGIYGVIIGGANSLYHDPKQLFRGPLLPNGKNAFQDLFQPVGFGGGGSSEDLLSRGVKRGTLEALREYSASLDGIQNAAYTTGGNGSGNPMLGGNIPKFGNKDFPNLGDWVAGAGGGGHRKLAKMLGMDKGGGGAAGGGINRDKWLAQLNANPALKDELYRRSLGENTDPMANQAVMEEAANRADIRGNKNFADHSNLTYFAGRFPGAISAKQRAMLDSNFDKVFRQGSDISGGAIDNSSQGLAYVHEHGGQSGRYGRPGLKPGRFKTTANFGGDRITGHRGVESFEIPGWGESGGGERDRWPAYRAAQLKEAGERRDLLTNEAKAGRTGGGQQKIEGGADLRVAFENAPSGMKAHLKNWGVFGDPAKVDWGHAMSPSDPGGR